MLWPGILAGMYVGRLQADSYFCLNSWLLHLVGFEEFESLCLPSCGPRAGGRKSPKYEGFSIFRDFLHKLFVQRSTFNSIHISPLYKMSFVFIPVVPYFLANDKSMISRSQKIILV